MLALEIASPEYVALKVLSPTTVGVREHLPTATVAEQLAPAPSLTVTVPLGTPPAAVVTVKVTVMGCPTMDGSGASEAMTVVVLAPVIVNTPAV